jgi:conjugation system TraG family ATPase
MMKNDTIMKMFPIYTVEDNLLVSKKGDITVAYKLMLPKVYSLDITDIQKINDLFDRIIRSFPEDTIIQKQDYFFVDTIKDHNIKDESIVLGSKNGFFYEKPLLHQESYLFITKDSKNKISLTSTQKCYNLYSLEVKSFLEQVFIAISFLENSGFFSVKKLDDDEIIKIVGKYFSLSKKGDTSVKDLFFDKRLQVGNNYGEIYVITAPDLPIISNSSMTNDNASIQHTDFQIPFIQPICLGLECNHIYNQVIYIDSTANLVCELNQHKNSPIQSLEHEITYKTPISELVSVINDKQLKLVNLHFSVILWDVEEDHLQRGMKQLENSFEELGIIPYQIKHGIKDLFMNNAPGASVYIPDRYKFMGFCEQVPVFLNFESYYKGNKEGILFNDRKLEIPIRLDLWEEPVKRGLIDNRNRLVFGSMERGETFLINHIAGQYYEQGHHIMIMDIGDSYQKLCHEVEGQYYKYELNKPFQFNPFYAKSHEEITTDKKEFLCLLIKLLWKGEGGVPIKNEDKQIIEVYIDRFYDFVFLNEDVVPSLFSFYEFVARTDINKVCSTFDKVGLLASLKYFYDGTCVQVFNSSDSNNLVRARFVVFELSDIKNDPVLYPLLSLLCVNVIMEKAQNMPEVKKSIFINECWKPIASKELSGVIKSLYKTVNNFYSELVIIANDIDHILDQPAGNIVIEHTDTIIMLCLKNKKEAKNKLATHLSFTESDLDKLFSISKREVFIKVGNLSNIYVIEEILCRLPRFRTPINLANNYY